MLAVKVFDGEPSPTTREILEAVSRDPSVGVELADYRDGRFEADRALLSSMEPIRKSMHVAHDVCALVDLSGPGAEDRRRAFGAGTAYAAACGAKGGCVIHAVRTEAVPHAPRADGGAPFPMGCAQPLDRVLDGAEAAAEICAPVGPLFVENTFEDLDSFAELVAALSIRRAGSPAAPEIGICLDVGHARVWGGGALLSWIDLLDAADAAGLPLHAHLHWSHGVLDDHLPLIEADRLGVLRSSIPKWALGSVLPEIARAAAIVARRSGHAVLENTMEGCLENLAWAKTALAPPPSAIPPR